MLHETLEYLGIAFVCSALLIIMSKIILQALIRRPADYYTAEELRQEELMLNAAGISITREHETNPEGVPIEETHLEAHLGDSEAAEPEEIIEEIPESVHESIEVSETEAGIDDGTVAPLYNEGENNLYSEDEVLEPDVSVFEINESRSHQFSNEMSEKAATDSEDQKPEEPVSTDQRAEEPNYTFKLKAKTSRTKKVRNKEEEEAHEDLEQVRAAMDDAKIRSESEPVSEWTESYSDIRSSLEKAFSDKMSRSAELSEESIVSNEGAEVNKPLEIETSGGSSRRNNRNKGNNRNNRSNRRRAPSMNMNKKELTEIAKSRGIEVPEEATKREILDLIYKDRRNRY